MQKGWNRALGLGIDRHLNVVALVWRITQNELKPIRKLPTPFNSQSETYEGDSGLRMRR